MISIGQLLEMRSGLYSYTSDETFNTSLDDDPRREYTPDELLAIAKPQPAQFAPGTEFNDSNTNYVLLGRHHRAADRDEPIAEVFEERIFEPLGLDDTSYPAADDPDIPDPHAQGYQFLTNVETIDSYARAGRRTARRARRVAGADREHDPQPLGVLHGRRSHLDAAGHGRLRRGDGRRRAPGRAHPGDPDRQHATDEPRASQGGYGYGLIEFLPELYGHDGQTPGYSSVIAYDLERDITIVVATNMSASPVDGNNAAIVLTRPVIGELYGFAGQ